MISPCDTLKWLRALSVSEAEWLFCFAEAEGLDARLIEAARLYRSGLSLRETGRFLKNRGSGGRYREYVCAGRAKELLYQFGREIFLETIKWRYPLIKTTVYQIRETVDSVARPT